MYLYKSINKIKIWIVWGYFVITAATGASFYSCGVTLVFHRVKCNSCLARSSVLVLCHCEQQSSTLTVPSTPLCASLQFGIPLAWTWVIGSTSSNSGSDTCWGMAQWQSSSFWVILVISPWFWLFSHSLCFSYSINFSCKITWYSFVETVSTLIMSHLFAMNFLSRILIEKKQGSFSRLII